MTNWGLAFEITITGIVSIAVILAVVTLIMWLSGKILRRFGDEESAGDR